MRVLFDQATPEPLRHERTAHSVSTTYELGWATLSNGDLLDAAEARFDAMVTTDNNLRYQQNLLGRRLAILVLPFASWPKLKSQIAPMVSAIDSLSTAPHE